MSVIHQQNGEILVKISSLQILLRQKKKKKKLLFHKKRIVETALTDVMREQSEGKEHVL